MAGLVDYEYNFFVDYQSDVLADLPSIEQLIRLDDEVANKVTMARYEGPVDPVEWAYLETYYSGLFADFISDRIQGLVDTEQIETNRDRFHGFRENIASLNQNLPAQRAARTGVISKPAETVLLKRLRRLGFDPSALDVSHIGRGGGLYLLELFVTAAQQEALSDTELLTALLDEADALGDMEKETAISRLHRPVLMVSLWENQENGLHEWLSNGRHGILEMATATGKTVAGIAAIAECCGVLPDEPDHEPRTTDANIMIVAHSNAILKQWEQEIQEKLGLAMPAGEAGEKAKRLSFSGGQVEFYTAQSLLPRYDRDLADQYDLVIYDEVHHYSNLDGYGAAIDRPNYRAAMGLSATIGDDGGLKREQLTELLGDVVYSYGVEDARRDGIIPDFDWTVHPTPLDPYEREEWEEATESISDQFKQIRWSAETERILEQIPVPFTELEDIGDFIRAHEAASMVFDDEEIPDEWSNLQATIHSRTWIRHRSQPKIEGAIELAKEYLEDPDQPVKLVIFAMDIDTTDEIADQLEAVTDDVYRAHSQLETSSRKNNERVQRNIDAFANCDNGVLVSPKMLDEGIDVPDAEVGINVAGTKTKLQLVQRMGRVLRKHGDQRPHFHHFIAIPDENYIAGLDSKEYVQELNWVRELGETIGVQPVIEEAGVDSELLDRAEQRGHELWARDLLEDLEVETVQGNVHLDQLLEELTAEATEILLDELWLAGDRVAQDDWETAMHALRESEALPVEGLQRVWWLFPLYHERPADLDELLTASLNTLTEDSSSQQRSQAETTTRSGNAPTDSDRDTVNGSTEVDEPEQEPSPTSTEKADQSKEPDPSQNAESLEPTESKTTDPLESQSTVAEDENDSGADDGDDAERPNVFQLLGVEESFNAVSNRSQIVPEVDSSIDENLLTNVGDGGFFSTGYLHQRSFQTYLLRGEEPVFLLSSKKKTPEYSERIFPELNGHRAITAITPTRILCVVGDTPTNATVQFRHEDITDVGVHQQGQFFWKYTALQIQTEHRTIKIPDGTGTDLETAARYIRAAVFERRCAAGQRLLECCDVVASRAGLSAVVPVLDAAKSQFKSASEWGDANDIDTSAAENGLKFAETCLERVTAHTQFEERLREIKRLVSDGRTASINGDESHAEQQYREAKTKLESILSTPGDLTRYPVSEARELHTKLEETLSTASDNAGRETRIGSETEGGSEKASDNDDRSPTRKALIEEIIRLDNGENLVPYASDMDADGAFKAYDCQQEFGSWDVALEAAGIDKRARLLEELRRIRDEIGRMPKTTDVNRYGRVSASMYGSFFGSWSEAISLIEDQKQETIGSDDSSHSSPESKQEPDSQSVLSSDDDDVLTWEDIPGTGRLPAPIAVQIKKERRSHSDSVDSRYTVADLDGKEFDLKIWQKHEIDIDLEIDSWYILDSTSGTVWESDGEVKRLLDSTRDLSAIECGPHRPTVADLP